MKGRQPQKPVCHASKLSSYRIGHHILSAFVQFATMQSRAKLWWRMPAYSLFFKTRSGHAPRRRAGLVRILWMPLYRAPLESERLEEYGHVGGLTIEGMADERL